MKCKKLWIDDYDALHREYIWRGVFYTDGGEFRNSLFWYVPDQVRYVSFRFYTTPSVHRFTEL